MASLTITGIVIFVVLLSVMSYTAGTQESLSALAGKWRWLLCLALWSQVLLLPQMIDMTPSNWQWMAFIGISGIVICGGANVLDKTDELIHVIAAIVSFVCLCLWVTIMNPMALLPVIVCSAAGKENWKWRLEIGLIIGVYMTLIQNYASA